MNILTDIIEYVLGSLIFFLVFFSIVKFLNRLITNIATEGINELIEKIQKNSYNKKDKKSLHKDKKLEQELDLDGALDLLQKEQEFSFKGKKNIVGINFKDAIKGRWTRMLVAKKMQILMQMDPKVISEKGIHQAMLDSNRRATGQSSGKGM